MGDELARRIRAFDWGATPLGPLSSWPQPLATAVDVVLASPFAMAVGWGADLVLLYNDRFAELLGAAHPASLGRRAEQESTGLIDAAACARALADQVAEAPSPDGRLTLHYAPLRCEGSRVGGVLVSVIDAPTRRQREATADLEQRLDLAMEASSAGSWSWDARTNESTWDDRYHAMYGFAPDAPRTHEAWLGSIHPEDRPRVVARLDAMLGTPGDDVWNMEFRAVCPGPGGRWMQGLGRAQRDADGRVVSITGINLDVTARKQAEEKLRESEEQLRLFFDTAPAAVAMFDRDMRYLAVSRRWLQYFGLPDAVLGRCQYDVFPDLPRRWRETNDRCLAGAVERSEEDRFERADGAVQWLKWQVLPWRTAAGDVGGIIVLCEDITESRHWMERQQVLIDELQHRTRNLITVVQSIAQQTMRATDSAEAFMTRFGRRLAALSRVQGLLSRADQEPITIGALVRMELDALGAEAASTRMRVGGPDVRLRKRDVQTLAMALHELATNARKHGALAARDGRLSVAWRVAGDAPGSPMLVLEWRESGLERRPERDGRPGDGYGRRLIERALPYALSAETSFEVGEEEFRCTIRLPLDAVENAAAAG